MIFFTIILTKRWLWGWGSVSKALHLGPIAFHWKRTHD